LGAIFAQIFNKSKLLGVRLHLRLLHQWAAANAVALLSTVENVVLTKCARYLADRNKLVSGP